MYAVAVFPSDGNSLIIHFEKPYFRYALINVTRKF